MKAILFLIILIIITIKYIEERSKNKVLIKKNQSKEKIIVIKEANSAIERNISWNKKLIKSLEWKRYEEVCTEYLRLKNCNAEVTCTGADGGVDIKIKDQEGNLFAIGQCKSWSKAIGVNLIRELYGVMMSEKAEYGLFFTTTGFTLEAIRFKQGKKIILIDTDELLKLINELNEDDRNKLQMMAIEGDYKTPTCVSCNTKMVKRIVKNGRNSGNEFWGCANYPRCKQRLFISSK